MIPLLSACAAEAAWLDGLIRELVRAESPSTDPAALEACAQVLSARLSDAGAAVTRLPADGTAAHVLAEWPGDGPRVLLIGHFDTVWPVGQIERMPIREEQGRLFGPGVFDMKAGLGIAALAMRVLLARGAAAERPRVRMLATSDEEVGSATSRAHIERLARESSAVLVLEPALPGGAVKTSRKGVGEFHLVAHGISAHAGASPEAGASAVHEIARQITDIQAFARPAEGLTVNVGRVEGGTRGNVVAERAEAVVDVRISRLGDAAGIEAAFAGLRARDPRVRLEVTGGINRPPMERSDGVARLYGMARDVAAELGWDLAEGGTGGGSDGNFTAALGIPTLDGLGAVGHGAHALDEHVLTGELPGRAALLAGLLQRLR